MINLNKISVSIAIITTIIMGLIPYILVCAHEYSWFPEFEQFEPKHRVLFLISIMMFTAIGFMLSIIINMNVQDFE